MKSFLSVKQSADKENERSFAVKLTKYKTRKMNTGKSHN